MYINPFIAGVLFVLMIELAGLVLYGAILIWKENNDGQEK